MTKINLSIAAKLLIQHGVVGLFYALKLQRQERQLQRLQHWKELEKQAHRRQIDDLDDAINALLMTQISTRHAAARYWQEVNAVSASAPSKSQP